MRLKYTIDNQTSMGNYYNVAQALRHACKKVDGSCGKVFDSKGRQWVMGKYGRPHLLENAK